MRIMQMLRFIYIMIVMQMWVKEGGGVSRKLQFFETCKCAGEQRKKVRSLLALTWISSRFNTWL